MVYYGPWTQESDYESTLSDPTPGGEAGSSVLVGHWLEQRSMPPGSWAPAFPLTSAAMAGAVTNNDGGALSAPNAAAQATSRYYVGGGGDPLTDPWISEGEAWHNFRLRAVAPFNASGYYFYPDLPDAAIGIEWQDGSDPTQGLPATWLDCTLTSASEVRGHLEQQPGNYVPPFVTEVCAIDPASVVFPVGSATFEGWTGPGGGDAPLVEITGAGATLGSNLRPLGVDINLTGHLDAEGRMVLGTKTADATLQGDDPQGSGFSTTISYGWWLSTVVTRWTFRPPVYRVVYDEPPTVPYRRVFPRDDGLAGGAPRTYPRPKSQQSSNRVVGAIF